MPLALAVQRASCQAACKSHHMYPRVEVVSGVIRTTSGDTRHQLVHTSSHHSMADHQLNMASLVLLKVALHYTMLHSRLALVAATQVLAHTNHRRLMVLLRLHMWATHLQHSQCRVWFQVSR